jgi:hypothetical protein
VLARAAAKLVEVVGAERAEEAAGLRALGLGAAAAASPATVPAGLLALDGGEVDVQWWEDGPAEGAERLRGRLRELLRQVQYAPADAIVLVTHGSVISNLLAAHGAPTLRPPAGAAAAAADADADGDDDDDGAAAALARAWLESGSPLEEVLGPPPRGGEAGGKAAKIGGCAIAACRLDFSRGSRVIVSCDVIKPRGAD